MTSIDWDTFNKVIDLETKFKKQEQIIKNILEENKILRQELNDAKYSINLLEKQISGVRKKVNTISQDVKPPSYSL